MNFSTAEAIKTAGTEVHNVRIKLSIAKMQSILLFCIPNNRYTIISSIFFIALDFIEKYNSNKETAKMVIVTIKRASTLIARALRILPTLRYSGLLQKFANVP